MYNRGKILLGLVIFFGLCSIPFWYTIATGKASYEVDLTAALETAQARADALGYKGCIMEAEEMIPEHMGLLNDWRDEVVREGLRDHVRKYEDGTEETFDKSLTRTCLGCHEEKSQFCDQCHDYTGVKPYCWDCHVDPKENK